VRVDDHVEAARPRLPARKQIVNHTEAIAADRPLDRHRELRIVGRIAVDDQERRTEPAKTIQHCGRSPVTGVPDFVDPGERL
jgi:hypothetical protein